MDDRAALCTRHAERLSAIETNIAEGCRQFAEIDRKLDLIQHTLTGNGGPGLCETVRNHERVISRMLWVVATMIGAMIVSFANWLWGVMI